MTDMGSPGLDNRTLENIAKPPSIYLIKWPVSVCDKGHRIDKKHKKISLHSQFSHQNNSVGYLLT